jgi:aminoglycoside phosphotransferase
MKPLAYYVEGVAEGRRGTLVQRQKDRSVWRVEEDGRVWFAKRGVTPKRRRELRREAENARALEGMNFGPPVLASGAYDDAEWIVTAAAPGRVLRQALFAWKAAARRSAFESLGVEARALHEGGVHFPDLTADHVFLVDGARRPSLIDAARMRRGRGPTPIAERATDLAALIFSLPWGVAARADRARLLRAAAGGGDDALRRFDALVGRRIVKLAARTRWRHEAWGATPQLIEALDVARGDDQSPVFDGLMDRRGMEVVRTLPDRENRRLDTLANGSPCFFVKVFPPTKSGWSPAMREIAAIDLFQRAGVLVNRLAAYAEDVDKGSMVAVKAAAGEPLDDLLRRGVPVAERRALAVQTARIWRRMRECGLRHRDAYPCHLFAAPWTPAGAEHDPCLVGARLASPLPSAGNRPTAAATQVSPPQEGGRAALRHELRLIDMTRAGKAPFPKERWFVKDAAALWHGLPKPPVTRTDAVRWLREYFRIERLDARAKRFARRVAAKEARIAARQARKARR